MSFFIPYLLDFPLQDQVGAGLQGPDPLLLGAHGARASSSWNLLVPHGGGKLAGRSRRPRQLSAFFIVSQSQRWCCLQCGCAVLGALGLLAGAGVGSWLLGQCWALLSGGGGGQGLGAAWRHKQMLNRHCVKMNKLHSHLCCLDSKTEKWLPNGTGWMQVSEGQLGPTILLLVWIVHGFSQFPPPPKVLLVR